MLSSKIKKRIALTCIGTMLFYPLIFPIVQAEEGLNDENTTNDGYADQLRAMTDQNTQETIEKGKNAGQAKAKELKYNEEFRKQSRAWKRAHCYSDDTWSCNQHFRESGAEDSIKKRAMAVATSYATQLVTAKLAESIAGGVIAGIMPTQVISAIFGVIGGIPISSRARYVPSGSHGIYVCAPTSEPEARQYAMAPSVNETSKYICVGVPIKPHTVMIPPMQEISITPSRGGPASATVSGAALTCFPDEGCYVTPASATVSIKAFEGSGAIGGSAFNMSGYSGWNEEDDSSWKPNAETLGSSRTSLSQALNEGGLGGSGSAIGGVLNDMNAAASLNYGGAGSLSGASDYGGAGASDYLGGGGFGKQTLDDGWGGKGNGDWSNGNGLLFDSNGNLNDTVKAKENNGGWGGNNNGGSFNGSGSSNGSSSSGDNGSFSGNGSSQNSSEFGKTINNILGDNGKSYNSGSNDWAKSNGGDSGSPVSDFLGEKGSSIIGGNSASNNGTALGGNYFGNNSYNIEGNSSSTLDGLTGDLFGTNNKDFASFDGDNMFAQGNETNNNIYGANGFDESTFQKVLGQLGINEKENEDSLLAGAINGNGSLLNDVVSGVSQILGGEAVATMTEQDMFDMAKKLLVASGYNISSLLSGKNYDGGSAYTEPDNAWDMNRMTKLLSNGKIKLETEEVIAMRKAAENAKKSSLVKNSEQGAAFLPKAQENKQENLDEQNIQDMQDAESAFKANAAKNISDMQMPNDAEFEQKIKEAEEMLKATQNP